MYLQWNSLNDVLNQIGLKIHINGYCNSSNSLYGKWELLTKKVFFKIVLSKNWELLKKNTNIFSWYFNTPQIIEEFPIGNNYICLVYEYIEESSYMTANDFLACPYIPDNEKIQTFQSLYEKIKNISLSTISKEKNGEYPSKKLFEKRFGENRLFRYYWNGYKALFDDIDKIFSKEKSDVIKSYLTQMEMVALTPSSSCFCFGHWDFHEFNFWFRENRSGEYFPIFVDLETAGYNPILWDMATYYWNILFQGDYLYTRYSQSHASYARSISVYLRNKQIAIYISTYIAPVIIFLWEKFPGFDWKKELTWRLLLRILAVHNVLEYSEIDRKIIYKIVYQIINWWSWENSILDLPFSTVPINENWEFQVW